MTLLDPLGAFFALISTYYFTQAKLRAFPLSIITIIINSFLYFQKGIYAHLGLEAIYLISTIIGWIYWAKPKTHKNSREITRLSPLFAILLLLLSTLGISIIYFMLNNFTNSNIPLWDASTTMLALIGQFLICQKKIECWFVWLVVDALVLGMHIYKGIPFHAATKAIYLSMAVIGYLKWRKLLKTQIESAPFALQ